MSYENFVRVDIVTPVAIGATSFAIKDAVAPNRLPAADGGYLVVCDSPGNPAWIEVVKYTSRTALGINGVTRAQEGTTARAWSGQVYALQTFLAGEANLIQSVLAGKQDEIAPGVNTTYFRGDKTWRDFMTDVRLSTLTGLSLATGTAVTAADSVLAAMGKLQKQITDDKAALSGAGWGTAGISGSNIPASSDLNNYKTPGSYGQTSNAQATLVLNYPIALAGTLLVQTAGTSIVTQRYSLYNGSREWFRAGYNDVWSDWVEVATTANIMDWVRTTVLTGLVLTSGTAISASDTVLGALGKLQKQVSDAATNLAANVRATVLTGYVVGSNAALAATDTVLGAFGKVQAQINAKANTASPALTGTPTAPTAAAGTNSTQIATTAFTQTAIANLIASAPGALDTLDELAAAMGDDPNFAATMTNALAGKEPSIALDTVDKYWAGNKTWRDHDADVRTALLTGLVFTNAAAVVAGDTLIVGLGKLQKQITDLAASKLSLSGGTMTGSLNEAPIVTLASAATVNINAAAGNTISITGTTTITSLGAGVSGAKNRLIFTGALTLTHNATSLILPGAANYVTAAGDVIDVVSLGGSNWRCVNINPADGQPQRTVTIANGGTGATSQAGAQTALGLVPDQTAGVSNLVQRNSAGTIAFRQAEIGLAGTASTPYLDFHSSANNIDYDSRIMGSGGTGTVGQGRLDYVANAGHYFEGALSLGSTLYSAQTINAANGVFANGSRCFAGTNTHQVTNIGQYSSICGPSYMNLTAAQQVYCSGLELRENGLVGSGGPSPQHVYNAPGITFHWGSLVASKLFMVASGNLAWGNPDNTYCQLQSGGNIYGAAWGNDFLSNFIYNNYAPKLPSCTAIGGFALAKNLSGAFQGLDFVVAGSSLSWSDTLTNAHGALSGTWRSMGACAVNASGIFMRVA